MISDFSKLVRKHGLAKSARGALFNGHRIDRFSNFTEHCCYLCGNWMPCEMERCTHAVCVRILSCCDPHVLTKKDRQQARERDAATALR